jgi:putative transposase
MKSVLLTLLDVIVMTAKLCGPGGVRAVIAENLLLKQQLIVDKNVVYRVLSKHYRPAPGGSRPSWLSFIGHTTDSLWSGDLFRCESVVLRSYWVLVVMDQFTRRLVGFGVHRGPVNAADVCRMFNAAIHSRGTPRHPSTDHDPLFEAHRWTANLRILEIDEIKTVPYVPVSHPFVERLIGTIRREFLDQVLFWNARDLERKLADFQAYDNAARSHAALQGHTPLTFAGGHVVVPADLNHVRWVSPCRDLVQLPVAA